MDLCNRANELLADKQAAEALSLFKDVLRLSLELPQAHRGIGLTYRTLDSPASALPHLVVIIERSPLSACLGGKGMAGLGGGAGNHPLQASWSTFGFARKALAEVLAVLTQLDRFAETVGLCERALALPALLGDVELEVLKEKARRGETQQVVTAIVNEFDGRVHWYQCPNGHYYVIGDCGRAVEVSQCPDCKSQVGGRSYTLVSGNRYTNIVGITLPT